MEQIKSGDEAVIPTDDSHEDTQKYDDNRIAHHA